MSACSAFADGGEYQLYLCQSNIKASMNCDGCIKKAEMTFTFKVQPLNNTVLRTTYKKNVVMNDLAYENCKVVDAKNWQCDSSYKNLISTQTMSNGKYRTLIAANQLASATCAKKKSFFD